MTKTKVAPFYLGHGVFPSAFSSVIADASCGLRHPCVLFNARYWLRIAQGSLTVFFLRWTTRLWQKIRAFLYLSL